MHPNEIVGVFVGRHRSDRRDAEHCACRGPSNNVLLTCSVVVIGHYRGCQAQIRRSEGMGFLVHSGRTVKPPGRSPAPHERKLSTQHTWASWCTPSAQLSPRVCGPPTLPRPQPSASPGLLSFLVSAACGLKSKVHQASCSAKEFGRPFL
jgi:hypothetical protein